MLSKISTLLQDVGLPSIAEDLVRDINRHAEVVLAGVDAMASAGSIAKVRSLRPMLRSSRELAAVHRL